MYLPELTKEEFDIMFRTGKISKNFDALNDLFAVFNDNFEGFEYYNLLDDIRNNADTPRTQIYYQIAAERDKILEKMRAHSMQHEAAMTEEQPQVEDTAKK